MKHNPLPFHANARPAALAAIAVQRAHGDAAFFDFSSYILQHQQELGVESLLKWMALPMTPGPLHPSSSTAAEQLDRDVEWAQKHGISGTPGFLINGREVQGAQPVEEFTRVIDGELAAIETARREGKPTLYSRPRARELRRAQGRVAIGGATTGRSYRCGRCPSGGRPFSAPPTRSSPSSNSVTTSAPSCKRVQATLHDRVIQRYGGDVRIVFKHNPLPFHPHARPAAGLALEAYREKGNAGFWQVTRSLFGADPAGLEDDALLALGKTMQLDPRRVQSAVKSNALAPEIDSRRRSGDGFRGARHAPFSSSTVEDSREHSRSKHSPRSSTNSSPLRRLWRGRAPLARMSMTAS